MIKLGNIGMLIVVTGSMEPTIQPKEMLIITEKEEYNVGDIITYKDKYGSLITHRIVKKYESTFITKGDNNQTSDDIIKKIDIEGKVILHSYVLGLLYLYGLRIILFVVLFSYIFDFLKYILLIKLVLLK